MKNKVLIIAGIVLTILVIGLILISGASTPKGVPTQKQYEILVDKVVAEIEGEDNKEYELSLLTDNIQFNSKIENKNYKKLTIQNKENYKSKGIVFMVKTESNTTINFSLYKNDDVLKTSQITFTAGESSDVPLLLDSSVEINTSDKFYVLVEEVGGSNTRFVFDNLLSFFDGE